MSVAYNDVFQNVEETKEQPPLQEQNQQTVQCVTSTSTKVSPVLAYMKHSAVKVSTFFV